MRSQSGVLATVAFAALMTATSHARADGALPTVATPVQREQAQARFARGKDLMKRRDYDGALGEFRASHDIVASPNTRLELARCLRAMEKLVAAYAELGRAAIEAQELKAEDNRYERAYDAASAERADLQKKLGFVTLTIENPSDGTTISVGGEVIRRAAWSEPAPALAGTTEIVVATPGHAPTTRSVTLSAGESTAVTIDAQLGAEEGSVPATPESESVKVPSQGASRRTWAYVAGGVGIAGLGTFALFGTLAHSKYDQLQTTCAGGPCARSMSDTIAAGKTDQTIANVGLVVGILGAAAATTLFVLSLKKTDAVSLVVAPGWAGVRGTLR